MESLKRIFAIYKKEMILSTNTALGYIFIILFMFVENLLFFYGIGGNSFWDRKTSDLNHFFTISPLILLLFVSAISMRTWSEEKDSGTWEILLTLPFLEYEIVLGKYLAACTNVLFALFSTIMIPLTTIVFGYPDFGVIFSGYIGLLLVGLSFVSVTFFVSLFANSQIGSFLLSFFSLSFLFFIGIQKLIDLMGRNYSEWIGIFSISKHFESFRMGILDPRDFYFFISFCGLFLALTILNLRTK